MMKATEKKNIYRRKWIKNSERKISYCLQFHTLCHFYLVMHPISIAYPFEREKNVFFCKYCVFFSNCNDSIFSCTFRTNELFYKSMIFLSLVTSLFCFYSILSSFLDTVQVNVTCVWDKTKKIAIFILSQKIIPFIELTGMVFFLFCFFTIVGGFGEIHCDFRTIEIISMNSIEYNSMLLEFFSSFHFYFYFFAIWSRNGFSSKDYLHTTSDWIPVRNVMNKISKS